MPCVIKLGTDCQMKRQVEEVAAAPGKAPITADLLVCVGSLRGQTPGRPSCHLGCSLDEEWTAGVFDESEKKKKEYKGGSDSFSVSKRQGKIQLSGIGRLKLHYGVSEVKNCVNYSSSEVLSCV